MNHNYIETLLSSLQSAGGKEGGGREGQEQLIISGQNNIKYILINLSA